MAGSNDDGEEDEEERKKMTILVGSMENNKISHFVGL